MIISIFLSRVFHSLISRIVSVSLIAMACSIPAFCGEIHDAARVGDLAKVQSLLKENPDLVFSKDNNGNTPLDYAVWLDHKDIAELLLPFLGYAPDNYIPDSSDWWSLIRREEVPDELVQIKEGNKKIDDANFEIAGVALGDNQFKELAKKFGKADEITRGDAASGRHQVCYESLEGSPTVRLIFEFGEVEANFYLLEGGKSWSDSKACLKSKSITKNLKTRSGLRLGLNRSKVEAILGPPDAVRDDRIYYSRITRRRTTKKEFEEMRKYDPKKLSDQEAHSQFDFIEDYSFIEIHFENSRLVYLAVSRDIG
jgi:hypothetical protein